LQKVLVLKFSAPPRMLGVSMGGLINPAAFAELAKAEREFWWHRGMRRMLFRLLDPLVAGRSIRTALDAGWGTGYFARLLQGRYDWRVFPLAVGWEGQFGVERLAQSDPAALPFSDGAFDAVFSIDLMSHFEPGQEEAPLRELARVLAPGGLMALRAGAFEMFRGRYSQYIGERQRFRRTQLVEAVERAGIRPLRCTYVNALLAPLALAWYRGWEPLARGGSHGLEPPPGWLDRLLYAPLAAESWWLGAGLNFPFGQTVLLLGEKAG
jgi:SAM-dependent methyltransferase